MITESPGEAHTTRFGIAKERFLFFFEDVMSHGIPPTFYHEAEKNCKTRRSHINRKMERARMRWVRNL